MLKLTGTAKSPSRKITFALPADHPAGKVSVVGNFNDWTPGAVPLKKRSNGTMSATVTVPADYIIAFRYLGENDTWFDEPDADFVDHGASVIWARAS
ncbi:MAG TPA: isoamylase early set domain-containing protein [Micropruina sp.]|jgi:1,4-alpha-glucan branching enzyme|nr:isoamylase early set domain-containing protein [Micropruina sp.]